MSRLVRVVPVGSVALLLTLAVLLPGDTLAQTTDEAAARALVEAWFDTFRAESFDVDRLMRLYSDDVAFFDPTFELEEHGKAAVRELYAAVGTDDSVYTDMAWTLDRVLVDGDHVGVHGNWSGKFRGVPFDVPFVTLWTLRDGVIAEQRDFFAAAMWERQVGWTGEGADGSG